MIHLSTPGVHVDAGTQPDVVTAARRTDGIPYTIVHFGPVDLYFHELTAEDTAAWFREVADRIEAS